MTMINWWKDMLENMKSIELEKVNWIGPDIIQKEEIGWEFIKIIIMIRNLYLLKIFKWDAELLMKQL